jgi:hypothetical protein
LRTIIAERGTLRETLKDVLAQLAQHVSDESDSRAVEAEVDDDEDDEDGDGNEEHGPTAKPEFVEGSSRDPRRSARH